MTCQCIETLPRLYRILIPKSEHYFCSPLHIDGIDVRFRAQHAAPLRMRFQDYCSISLKVNELRICSTSASPDTSPVQGSVTSATVSRVISYNTPLCSAKIS